MKTRTAFGLGAWLSDEASSSDNSGCWGGREEGERRMRKAWRVLGRRPSTEVMGWGPKQEWMQAEAVDKDSLRNGASLQNSGPHGRVQPEEEDLGGRGNSPS